MMSNKDWGDMSKTDAGLEAKDIFLSEFNTFVDFFESKFLSRNSAQIGKSTSINMRLNITSWIAETKIDLEAVVRFTWDDVVLAKLNERGNVIKLIKTDPTFLPKVEGTVRTWAKQIERVSEIAPLSNKSNLNPFRKFMSNLFTGLNPVPTVA